MASSFPLPFEERDVIGVREEQRMSLSILLPRPSNTCPWEGHVTRLIIKEIHSICYDSCIQIEGRIWLTAMIQLGLYPFRWFTAWPKPLWLSSSGLLKLNHVFHVKCHVMFPRGYNCHSPSIVLGGKINPITFLYLHSQTRTTRMCPLDKYNNLSLINISFYYFDLGNWPSPRQEQMTAREREKEGRREGEVDTLGGLSPPPSNDNRSVWV